MKEEQFLDDGRIIRTASIDDLNAVSAVEAECFPPAEAASKADFERRIRAYGNHFWLMFENGQLVSFVEADLTDDLYEHAELHDESGDWQMIFGVNTIPSCRKKGYAGELLRQAISDAKEQGRKGLVLTCKDKLIPYYSSFGFENEGISMSVHGNVVWYQMRLKF